MKTTLLAILVLLLLARPEVQAQFHFSNNGDGTATLVSYTGSNPVVDIPGTYSGLTVTTVGDGETPVFGLGITSVTMSNTVTSISDGAFLYCSNLASVTIDASVTNIGTVAFACTSVTNVTIPDSVTSLGDEAFVYCSNLTRVTIGNNVTSLGYAEFAACSSLTSVTLPNGLDNIGSDVFLYCSNLTSITIGGSVTNLGTNSFAFTDLSSVTIPGNVSSIQPSTFYSCTNLTDVYFQGNAPGPGDDLSVFGGENNATAFYRAGTTGWGAVYDGIPTVLWNPQAIPASPDFDTQTNQFGFTITGTSGLELVVEDCTNLAEPIWTPLSTNTLASDGSHFNDPQWTNFPGKFYRLRSSDNFTYYYPFPPLTVGSNLTLSVSNRYAGYTQTDTGNTGNWRLFEYDDTTYNPNCWVARLPWSCFIFGKGGINAPTMGTYSMTLITSRHAITTEHTGPVTASSAPIWEMGGDGNWYSNYLAGGFSVNGTDIQLVTFSNNWPSAIIPAMVMPTNFPSYCNYNYAQLPALYFRNNTRCVSGLGVVGYVGGYLGVRSSLNQCVFNDSAATGGDSSSPVFYLMGTNLVFAFPVSLGGFPQGPFISDTNNLSGILANIGTNQLRYPDLSGYTAY